MKLLIFGSNSQLGQSFTQLLKREKITYVAIQDNEPAIYQEASKLSELVRDPRPSQILNLSLNPGLFQSEADIGKQRIEQMNQACVSLIEAARALKIPLLQHSSVAVFDGANAKPYLETDTCNPKNPLGKLALSLERKVAKYARHIILRTEGIYDPSNTTFFESCINICKQQQGRLELLDQRCSPTPVADVARVFLAINKQLDCNASPWGIYHYCALQATHRHTFVDDFLRVASSYDKGLAAVIEDLQITTRESTKTQLENSVVDCQHIMASFGIKQRSRGTTVKDLIASLYA